MTNTNYTTNLYESPQKEANEEKYGLHTNQCVCCGKMMKEGEKKYVHMNTDWQAMDIIISNEEEAKIYGYQSQGYFPIGNSCAKKMPKNFVHQ